MRETSQMRARKTGSWLNERFHDLSLYNLIIIILIEYQLLCILLPQLPLSMPCLQCPVSAL